MITDPEHGQKATIVNTDAIIGKAIATVHFHEAIEHRTLADQQDRTASNNKILYMIVNTEHKRRTKNSDRCQYYGCNLHVR
jgi:hypothetical protein